MNFVLIAQHGRVALEVGHDGQRLALGVVNAEDDELAIDISIRIPTHGRRMLALSSDAAIDVDGPLSTPPVDMRGAETAVRLHNETNDLVD